MVLDLVLISGADDSDHACPIRSDREDDQWPSSKSSRSGSPPAAWSAEFLDADRDFQTDCLYRQRRHGAAHHGARCRRRVAGGDDVGIIGDADAAAVVCRDDPAAGRWATCVDPPSLITRRYTTLD